MKFLALFRRRRQREQELDEEIRAHLALPIRERIEQGENPAEAEVNAKHEFGNVTMIKEVTRDMWRWGWLETLFQDLRYGLRQLRRSPGFTAVAVVTLALGIGANAAIFSVVDGVLIHPLPFDNSSQLVMLWQRVQHFGANSFTTPDFLAWKKQAFMSIAATSEESFNISEGNGTEHVPGGPVSANFFSILGVKPIGGRGFLPDEDQQNGRRVVILSYGLWQRDFGGDLAVMGKALDLNGQPFTVIGIMPRGFRNGLQLAAQLWVPLESDPTFSTTRQTRSVHWLLVMGRLKANATLEQARAAMTAIAGSLGKEYPETDARLGVDVTPLADYIVGSIRPALLTLFVAVGLVLLIACANVANLLLAQATARAKEMAVRIAVGAGRARLVRQLLTESVLLATLGGALGLFFAFWSLSVLRRMNSGDIPRLKQISIDPGVLVFGVALCVGTGVLFGAAPAIQASKADLNETLKEGGRTSDIGSGRVEFRHLLVVSEVALSLILLVGAGLMIRSFSSLQQAPLGFNPHRLLTMQLSFTQPGHSAQETPLFYEQVLDRVRSLPGVESAAIARDLPLIGANPSSPFSIAGRPVASPEQRPIARYRAISPGYFRTLGVPLLKGRDFTDQDSQGAHGVAIINQAMARQFWPHQDPIGDQIEPAIGASGWCTIVGTVGDVRKDGAQFPIYPTMYYSYLQVPAKYMPLIAGSMRLVIRSQLRPRGLLEAVRQEVAGVNKEAPVYNAQKMDEIVSASMSQSELDMVLLGIFGLLALLMAVAAIYAVISYSVAQRTHEIGIRMALGARKGHVLTLVVGQGMILALIGVGIGIVGALGLTQFLSSLLYGVKPTDPLTFVIVSLVLSGVALLACYIPARRAAKVDPIVALRRE